IAAEESSNAAVSQLENRDAAVFDLRLHRAEHAGSGCNADDRLAGHIEQRVEPMAGEPTEKSAAAGGRIEQIVVGAAAGHVAGDERHLDAYQLAEGTLAGHPAEAIDDVVVAEHVARLKRDAAFFDRTRDL